MIFDPFPYFVIKDLMELEKMIMEIEGIHIMCFFLKKVILNLTGMSLYNPSRPWVYKIRSDKRIASDLFFYMDDDKLNSFFALECWKAAKRIFQIMSYLRIQDAYR